MTATVIGDNIRRDRLLVIKSGLKLEAEVSVYYEPV